jgi:hypothetical protein
MLIPLLTELVRVKDRSEVFQVVRLNLNEHTVDLVSLRRTSLSMACTGPCSSLWRKGRTGMTGKPIPGASCEPRWKKSRHAARRSGR